MCDVITVVWPLAILLGQIHLTTGKHKLFAIPEVLYLTPQGECGSRRGDESLFPELELWLHTRSSKVRTYLAWLNLGQIWQHLISQWADEGSLHDIWAAAGRRFRASQAGATAVLGSTAGESRQCIELMNKIYWGEVFLGKIRSEQHATSTGAEVCGGR